MNDGSCQHADLETVPLALLDRERGNDGVAQSSARHRNQRADEVHLLALPASTPDSGEMGCHQRLDWIVRRQANQREITQTGPGSLGQAGAAG